MSNMDAEAGMLETAGAKAQVVAEEIRAALGKLTGIIGEIQAGWVGTAPVAFQQIHETLNTKLTASAQDLSVTGDKVTGAAQQYRASQEQATQDVRSAEVV